MTEGTAMPLQLLLLPLRCPRRYTRVNPFPARLVLIVGLAVPNPQKTRVISNSDLGGWGLSFEVGDSLAVYQPNDPNWSIK